MLISLIITLLTAFLICSIFKTGLYFFPSFFGLIVLKLEILSLFRAINPIGIIFIDIIFLLITVLFWNKGDKTLYKPDFKPFLGKIYNAVKLDKILFVLLFAFIFLFITSLFLAVLCPVNEPDALSYHAFRAFVWANKGYIHHFVTPDVRNIVMPINSETAYTWICTLTKKDIGFGVLAFSSWVFIISVICAVLKDYKFSTRQILWCIFIFSSLSGVIAQISSTQTDLITGGLLLFGFYFYLKYLKCEKNHMLYFSTLASALAMGVKSTGAIGVLGIIITVFIINRRDIKKSFKFLLFLFLNFLIFSSYNYILNFIDYANPLGSVASVEAHRFWGTYKNVFANFIRYLFHMFDFSGFKGAFVFDNIMINIQNALLLLLNIDLTTGVNIERGKEAALAEQSLGFGVLGFMVFLPSLFISVFKKPFKDKKYFKMFGILFFINLLILSASIAYMVYNIRFITCFVVLSVPVIAVSYFKKNNFYKILTACLAVFYMIYVPLHLNQRPLLELVKSYGNSNVSYDKFLDNIRCSRLYYLKSESGSACGLRDYIEENYSDYKKIGFFPDNGLLILPVYLKIQEKSDILLLNRLEEYDMNNYDLLIISSPYQKVWNFSKDEKISSRCSYYARKDRDAREIQRDVFKYVSMADCALYYEDMDYIGFKFHSTAKIKEPNFNTTLVYSFWVKK